MFRPAVRIASTTSLARSSTRIRAARRFVSTAPPHQKSRSWKSSAARWGLAGALVYYYNTASVFAEEPAYPIHAPETSRDSTPYPTVASVSEERRAQSRSQAPLPSNETAQTTTYSVPDAETPAPGSPEELEQEASQEGAFNEETGEINWDCPCLGGMAYGPCGEQFRAAFSCFVFSKEEPKGVDCIEHFKAMQNCFREHPEIYGAELDDEDEASSEGQEDQSVAVPTEPGTTSQVKTTEAASADGRSTPEYKSGAMPSPATASEQTERARVPTEQSLPDNSGGRDEGGKATQAWHDARSQSQSS